MRAFAQLYNELDATTSNNTKLAAMQSYLVGAAPADAAWAVYFLSGGKPRQLVPSKLLRSYGARASGVPDWLFEESYHAVGDLGETLALLLPPGTGTDTLGLADWMQLRLLPLRGQPADAVMAHLTDYLAELDTTARFVCAKLLTGSLRVGVSKLLVTRALATLSNLNANIVAQRMMGYTDVAARPDGARYLRLIESVDATQAGDQLDGRPYPFFLAHPLPANECDPGARLGPLDQWQVEWKWDGIRAQLVRRGQQTWVWSRGEELMSDRFPELMRFGARLAEGTVLDGEIVVWEDGRVQPFARLQQRLGRKLVGNALLTAQPVVFLAYDILEYEGIDQRQGPQHARRALLTEVLARVDDRALMLSPLVQACDWQALAALRAESRGRGVEGVMLKARDLGYGIGRTKQAGVWWKWKIDPLSVDAVLLYAQRGHGRRASLYTDYTFGVWDAPSGAPERRLVPIAKAYSGLTDAEIWQVDNLIRRNTLEKFGPVRSVTPLLVFELGFEGIARSTRHKSGVALRFPRMLRWRMDKTPPDADTLASLNLLLPA
jgi:DNA ligase-1